MKSTLPATVDLLLLTEAADLLDTTWPQVRQWARDGVLPYALTPTGRMRVYRDGVQALLTGGAQ